MGRLRAKRARQALALSPDCADACVLLGEAAATPERALAWYEQAIEAGARAIGPEAFERQAGEFWSRLETRPYMRARLAAAQALDDLGRRDEAVEHYRDMLRLNPNDNQGVRELLLPLLFEEARDVDAVALLDQYGEGIGAMWAYGAALRWLRAEGDTARSRAHLTEAVRANRHVPRLLALPEADFDMPPHYALGSVEEALYVSHELHGAWHRTPGAVDWLRAHESPPPPRATSRRPAVRRSRPAPKR